MGGMEILIPITENLRLPNCGLNKWQNVDNPVVQDMDEDVLYHLSLGSGSHDLREMFGDVK